MACGGRHKQGEKKEEEKEKQGVELVWAGKILPELEEGFGGF